METNKRHYVKTCCKYKCILNLNMSQIKFVFLPIRHPSSWNPEVRGWSHCPLCPKQVSSSVSDTASASHSVPQTCVLSARLHLWRLLPPLHHHGRSQLPSDLTDTPAVLRSEPLTSRLSSLVARTFSNTVGLPCFPALWTFCFPDVKPHLPRYRTFHPWTRRPITWSLISPESSAIPTCPLSPKIPQWFLFPHLSFSSCHWKKCGKI